MSDLFNAFPPSTGLQMGMMVNGRPITEVLSMMMTTIRSQEAMINDLQETIRRQHEEAERRHSRLEHYVAHVQSDLKLEMRPIGCYGQPAMPTISDSVTNVEYRLTLLEQRGKKKIQHDLLSITTRTLALRFFQVWLRFRRFREVLRGIRGEVRSNHLSYFFNKWKRYRQDSRKRRGYSRKLRSLQFVASKGLVLRYLDKWFRFLTVSSENRRQRILKNNDVARVMSTVTMRGLARTYFLKWFRNHIFLRQRYEQSRAVLSMEHSATRVLAVKYFVRWREHQQAAHVRSVRHRLVLLHATKAYQALARRYLRYWVKGALRRRRRMQGKALIPRLHHLQLTNVARRYFFKFCVWTRFNQEKKLREEWQGVIHRLSDRADALSTQLDVGLQTLSHTNAVLARVVDVVIQDPEASARFLKTAPAHVQRVVATAEKFGHGRSPAASEGRPTATRHVDTSVAHANHDTSTPSLRHYSQTQAAARTEEHYSQQSEHHQDLSGNTRGSSRGVSSAADLLEQLRQKLAQQE